MAKKFAHVTINSGELPSAHGVAEGYPLSEVIRRWQSIAHGSFREDCQALKQMITETDELRLWEKNVGGFRHKDREDFLRHKVLIDYELTERDMTEIVALLRCDDVTAIQQRLAKRANEVEAADLGNVRPVGTNQYSEPVRDENNVPYTHRGRPHEGTAESDMRRLRKDRPDIHAKVLAGKLSAHAGMIEAGFRTKRERKKLSAVERVLKQVAKLSDDEWRELQRALFRLQRNQRRNHPCP
jgi:hypothetical protein